MSSLSLFNDNFNDNSIDTSKWFNWGGTNIVEEDYMLKISTDSSSAYYGIETSTTYDSTGTGFSAQVLNSGDLSIESLETEMNIYVDGDNRVFFNISGYDNTISAYQEVGGTVSNLAYATYDPVEHRWLRIREDGGTTYWETSRDGINWNILHSASNPITFTSVYVGFVCGKWDSVGGATTAIFDNVNISPSTESIKVGSGAMGSFYAGQIYLAGSPKLSQELYSVFVDMISVMDNKFFKPIRSFVDEVVVTENFGRLVQLKTFIESIHLVDSATIARVIALILSETIRVIEKFAMNLDSLFVRAFVDVVVARDSITTLFTKVMAFVDSILSADSLSRGVSKVVVDTMSIRDSVVKNMARVYADVISILDNWSKRWNAVITLVDSISITESWSRIKLLTREFVDNMGISDSVVKSVNILLGSTVQLRDSIVRRWNGMILNWDKTVQKVGSWLSTGVRKLTTTKIGRPSGEWNSTKRNVQNFNNLGKENKDWSKLKREQ